MNKDALLRALSAFIAPLNRRIQVLLQRSVVVRTSYDQKVRLLQIKKPAGVALSDIEHLEPFGFTSHAPKGAECIALAFGGNGSHTVGLLIGDRRYRLVIEEGEAAIYNQAGDYLKFKKDSTAELKAATKVIIDSPAVEVTGTLKVAKAVTFEKTLKVAGMSTLTGDAVIAGIQFSTHVHTYTDTPLTAPVVTQKAISPPPAATP